MGLENDSSRPLLESTGWLAAHRRQQVSLKQNPVHSHGSSLNGEVSRTAPMQSAMQEWRSWSLGLFRRAPMASEESSGLTDA